MIPKKILFTSDLSVQMKAVFEHAATVAVFYNADIIILHVLEEEGSSAERLARTAFGEDLFNEFKSQKKNRARIVLSGKNVTALRIKKAIAEFFIESGKTDGSENESLIKDIIVAEGRSIEDEITATVIEENCDLVVMGWKQGGMLSKAFSNHITKKVLDRTTVPVFSVPYKKND